MNTDEPGAVCATSDPPRENGTFLPPQEGEGIHTYRAISFLGANFAPGNLCLGICIEKGDDEGWRY